MGLLLLNGESGLNPRTLFANGEQGLWLDPSQLSTMYQDSNGVTPCTDSGQPVGLILDQSRGGLSQIGADLVTNGTFAADTDWTKGANWTIGSGVATKTGGAANNLTQTIGSTAAAWYRISLDATRTAGTLTVSLGTSGTTYAITATGSYTFFILAGSGTQTLTLAGDSSFAGTVDNVVVKNVPGNHAYQSSSSARPTLARIPSSGRRNVLTYSEQLDNAAWVKTTVTVTANQAVAPDGTTTADLLAGLSGTNRVRQTATVSSGTAHTASIYVKKASSSGTVRLVYFDGTSNVFGSDVTLTDDWQRISLPATTTSTSYEVSVRAGSASAATECYIWGAQLETGSTATNYQKVVATTDVTESGVGDLWHLVFDGSDDSLVTNSVDFSGTDEMTVIAGVRKLSDAATGVLLELSTTSAVNTGVFLLSAPPSDLNGYFWRSKGTGDASINTSTPSAPATNVVTCLGDIGEDLCRILFDGVEGGLDTTDQGSGNFGNYALYIGRRAGSSLPFNGHIYQLIIRGKTTPTGKLLEAEKFVSKKTGVNL